MDSKVKRAVVIGLDAPIAHRVKTYAEEGKLPAIAKLIEHGVYAEQCLVPFPTITPPNWTTIATGAWPGTHEITDFHVHTDGEPFEGTPQSLSSELCKAEYIWEAAEKVGKKSIVINYPSTWPPRMKDGFQIGGAGVWINEWRGTRPFFAAGCTLAAEQLFSIEDYLDSTQVTLKEASGWENAPKSSRSLEAKLDLIYRDAEFPIREKSWHLLILDTKGEGYDQILLSESKNADLAFASLQVGHWSKRIEQEFETKEGSKRVAFKCKLIELSKDAQRFRLYITGLCALDGWSSPESISSEIKSEEGLPMVANGFFAFGAGWIDAETFVETCELEHLWLGDA